MRSNNEAINNRTKTRKVTKSKLKTTIKGDKEVKLGTKQTLLDRNKTRTKISDKTKSLNRTSASPNLIPTTHDEKLQVPPREIHIGKQRN